MGFSRNWGKVKVISIVVLCLVSSVLFFVKQRETTLRNFIEQKSNPAKFTQRAEITSTPQLQHKTFLLSRASCKQTYLLLVLVFTAPQNSQKRNIIRRTWGTDSSLQSKWKTMFLLGEANTKDESEFLEAERLIYQDIIRGAFNENYYNLSLKLEMGLEWATCYCNFKFLLKADDDVFINPFGLIEILQIQSAPRTMLYMGNVAHNWAPIRAGKYAVSIDEYNKTKYPDFCTGPAYVLSSDIVYRFVKLFGAQKRLKLEDVYVGILAETVGVKPIQLPGAYMWESRVCNHYTDVVVYHKSTKNCTEILHSMTLNKRMKDELEKLRDVNIAS